MVTTVTLKIPDEMYQRLELNAQATQCSIEAILALVLKVGSPPQWDDVPEEFQPDLQDLDGLTDEALHQLASASKIECELDHYDDLLEINATGSLPMSEQQELESLRKESERFMLRKAQAAVLIRWRGYKA
jgi:NADP-dependent 3-hydroxy acid dehydrogenase YdfG